MSVAEKKKQHDQPQATDAKILCICLYCEGKQPQAFFVSASPFPSNSESTEATVLDLLPTIHKSTIVSTKFSTQNRNNKNTDLKFRNSTQN